MIDVINKSKHKTNMAEIRELFGHLFTIFQIEEVKILEILFVNQTLIRKMNKEYLNKDKATDVLSFPQNNSFSQTNESIFGSIVICPSYIKVKDGKIDLKKYFIHGFIHLLGMDHQHRQEEIEWNKIENEINKQLLKIK